MTHADLLIETLANARVVLFDFDGPVCDVFAGLPAATVARELVSLLAARDAAAGAKAARTDDPVEVLRIAHEADSELGQEIEQALTAAEVRAVALVGQPTPGAAEALRAARAAGRGVAVVSDNSAECVRAFLELHGLRECVTAIVGRPSEQPHLMKPNPFPLITAAEQMHIDVTSCTLIGDSLTDVQAAHAAGATVIGYAGRSRDAGLFDEARADVVIEHMQDVADALTAE
ncbi:MULTISPECIES: HAD-IA family hydrolase [unclassified Streptomyces]|uniref:HAD-IA family hydrolase n=1 Tax=unclassified Streptomyces TaxID=2593676 RepID=UPI0006AEF510|nr:MULTISPECIES: HAD-IA family hydrolase [unclassified Streptomyces]KOX33666.1 haloacid dehalogenase [Streptomyces sp. NRRL F-6491]KOX37135.1 haloacid dehalogenase [Streptomyces sp. NRRL F-6492]